MRAFAGLWVASALLFAGCGFHLRGNDLSANFESAYVGTSRGVSIGDEMVRTLGFSGVEVVKDRSAADVIIELTEQREDRRTISVTERARAAEYEMKLEVRYRISALEADDEQVIVEERWVRNARIYRLDRDNVVGSSEEETLLRGEMERALVQEILRSLDTATRNMSAGAA